MSSSINVSSEDSLNLATFRGRRYPSPSSESELTSSVDEEDSNSMVQGEENASETPPRLGGNSTGTNSNMYLTYFVFGAYYISLTMHFSVMLSRGKSEMKFHDFGLLDKPKEWLNDNCVNSYIE